ncbi:MAG: type II secretion system major pseudopilin GspG [Bacteriovoracaceae bacterium]|nr:type II secretion system major pseudopilin GspG [Bacteriovoracaceae bacterium]
MFHQVNFLKKLAQTQKGFSLIEILIGLTLIGFAGTFVATKVYDRFQEGKILTVKTQISKLGETLQDFKRHCGFYPTTDQGLDALIEKPSGRECKRYAPGGYLSKGSIPLDPWDGEYSYESDGSTYKIISYGNDGIEGGEGFDADISSEDL